MKKIYFIIILTLTLVSSQAQKKQNLDKTKVRSTKDFIQKAQKKSDSLREIYEKKIPDSLIRKYLEREIQTLKLKYVGWGCGCPNWIEVDTLIWCETKEKQLINHVFYIEPKDSTNKVDIDTLFEKLSKGSSSSNIYVEIKGQFYKEKRLPYDFKHWEQYGVIRLARVFRYTDWEFKEVVIKGKD